MFGVRLRSCGKATTFPEGVVIFRCSHLFPRRLHSTLDRSQRERGCEGISICGTGSFHLSVAVVVHYPHLKCTFFSLRRRRLRSDRDVTSHHYMFFWCLLEGGEGKQTRRTRSGSAVLVGRSRSFREVCVSNERRPERRCYHKSWKEFSVVSWRV